MVDLVPFEPRHIDGGLALSSAEDWPQTRADWERMLRHGGGFAVLEDDGGVVGSALVIPVGDTVSAVAMVLVAPTHRRRGIGHRLMTRLIEVSSGRTLMLFATADGAPLYRQLGFRDDGSVAQCQGVIDPGHLSPPRLDHGPHHFRQLGDQDLAAIDALDFRARGRRFGGTLAEQCAAAQVFGLTRGTELEGYALARRVGHTLVVGPVVAPESATALELVRQVLCNCPKGMTRIDVDPMSGMIDGLTELGFKQVGTARRMLLGPDLPRGDGAAQVFAILGQDVG